MNIIDKIDFTYWHLNREKVNSKSFFVDHDGYRYGDGMRGEDNEYIIAFSYIGENGHEVMRQGNNSKESYFLFVEAICNRYKDVFYNYRNAHSEKYKLYSGITVATMPVEKKHSTRINLGENVLRIHDSEWYVAANLKISEYINAIDINLNENERHTCYIYLIDTELPAHKRIDKNNNTRCEYSPIKDFSLVMEDDKPYQGRDNNVCKIKPSHLDFYNKNIHNMEIGKIGELIVLQYEKERLQHGGRLDLVNKIKYVASEDDTAGYDISSFDMDGSNRYIEVKTTESSTPGRFYLSENERKVSENLGNQWFIYRIFSLNIKKGTGVLKVYKGPVTENTYDMKPTSWMVIDKIKESDSKD